MVGMRQAIALIESARSLAPVLYSNKEGAVRKEPLRHNITFSKGIRIPKASRGLIISNGLMWQRAVVK